MISARNGIPRCKAPDGLTYEGAHNLADKVRNYWKARGVAAQVWVIRSDATTKLARSAAWVVRSDVGTKLGSKPCPAH